MKMHLASRLPGFGKLRKRHAKAKRVIPGIPTPSTTSACPSGRPDGASPHADDGEAHMHVPLQPWRTPSASPRSVDLAPPASERVAKVGEVLTPEKAMQALEKIKQVLLPFRSTANAHADPMAAATKSRKPGIVVLSAGARVDPKSKSAVAEAPQTKTKKTEGEGEEYVDPYAEPGRRWCRQFQLEMSLQQALRKLPRHAPSGVCRHQPCTGAHPPPSAVKNEDVTKASRDKSTEPDDVESCLGDIPFIPDPDTAVAQPHYCSDPLWSKITFSGTTGVITLTHRTDSYEILGLISSGSFGDVFAARRGDSHELVAIKIIAKALAYRSEFCRNQLLSELEFMKKATLQQKPFITRLSSSWSDASHVFFVMPYCPTSLGSALRHAETPYSITFKTLAAQLILAVEQMHDMGYIHCDLKPDNTLIDRYGCLSLADFGLCQQVVEGKPLPLAPGGTYAYEAPEVISPTLFGPKGHDSRVDMWAVGLMLIEMYRPEWEIPWAREKKVERISFQILQKDIMETPALLELYSRNPDLWDLLSKLLIRNPSTRWTAKQCKQHRYFSDVDWNALEDGTWQISERIPNAIRNIVPKQVQHPTIRIRPHDAPFVPLGRQDPIYLDEVTRELIWLDINSRHDPYQFW